MDGGMGSAPHQHLYQNAAHALLNSVCFAVGTLFNAAADGGSVHPLPPYAFADTATCRPRASTGEHRRETARRKDGSHTAY